MIVKRHFGFETHVGRQIDLDRTDTTLANELAEMVSAWSACISCGSCTATCPSGINFRKIHYRIRLMGAEADISTSTGLCKIQVGADNYLSLQSCFLCGKCQLVCPRGIPTRYLAIKIIQETKHYAEDIPSV